jgi:hypothetical protein
MNVAFYLEDDTPDTESVYQFLKGCRGDGLVFSHKPVPVDSCEVLELDGKRLVLNEVGFFGVLSSPEFPPVGFEMKGINQTILDSADEIYLKIKGTQLKLIINEVDLSNIFPTVLVNASIEKKKIAPACTCEIISLMNRGCRCQAEKKK